MIAIVLTYYDGIVFRQPEMMLCLGKSYTARISKTRQRVCAGNTETEYEEGGGAVVLFL